MSLLISPSINPSGQQATQAGPRGRGAEQPERRSFGAALDRSRAGGTKASASAEAAPDSATARRPGLLSERKSELSAADVLALLAPLAAPLAGAVVATSADARQGSEAAASAGKGAAIAGVLPDGVAADGSAHALASADAGASQTAAAEQASGAERDAAAKDDAPDASHTAKPAGALDPTLKTALAAEAGAAPADALAQTARSLAAVVPAPAVSGAAKSASEAGAAAAGAPTDTPKTAAVQAAAGAASSIIAAAPEAKRSEAIDTDSASIPQTLPQLASALPAADRANAGRDATPVLSVAPPVGSHEWGPAIGQQMIRMSASGHQVAELNLNPAGLGPLKVTLTMGDNQAQAMFVSAHEGVRKAVEAALPQLRTTLADQGISLGHTSVGADTRQPSQQGGFAEQNPGRSSGKPTYPGAGRGIDNAAAAAQPVPTARSARAANAGLDTFA